MEFPFVMHPYHRNANHKTMKHPHPRNNNKAFGHGESGPKRQHYPVQGHAPAMRDRMQYIIN